MKFSFRSNLMFYFLCRIIPPFLLSFLLIQMLLNDSEAAKTTVHSWMDRRSGSQNPEKQIQQGLSGPRPSNSSHNRMKTWVRGVHSFTFTAHLNEPLCPTVHQHGTAKQQLLPYTNVFSTKMVFGSERERE
jgi:hypothetical protein